MKYSQDYYLVNDILAEWDPIGVPDNVAKTEYSDYVQRILNHRDKLNDIVKELERIVIKDIGLSYDPNNSDQNEHMTKFALKIYKGLKNYKLIDYDELFERVVEDEIDSDYKRAALALIEAMKDWPSSTPAIEDFVNEVKNDVGEQVLKEKLESWYTINEAWKMESSSSIIKMLDCFPYKSFDEIIQGISNHYKGV